MVKTKEEQKWIDCHNCKYSDEGKCYAEKVPKNCFMNKPDKDLTLIEYGTIKRFKSRILLLQKENEELKDTNKELLTQPLLVKLEDLKKENTELKAQLIVEKETEIPSWYVKQMTDTLNSQNEKIEQLKSFNSDTLKEMEKSLGVGNPAVEVCRLSLEVSELKKQIEEKDKELEKVKADFNMGFTKEFFRKECILLKEQLSQSIPKDNIIKLIDSHSACKEYHRFGGLNMTCLDVIKGKLLDVDLETKDNKKPYNPANDIGAL